MALHIKSDGTSASVSPGNGTTWSLSELQGFVGGYIELVGLPASRSQIMVVNEEGLLCGLPMNHAASAEAMRPIVGDVLICDTKEIE